ncbi:phage baseplate assembly protein [Pseudomonas akapageensis]|uniref:phage baseplate assembly protein n=1 Tax=Pseudomonas akapageensis TaxID=2609961 RepID=UPI00140E2354|nr:baseplate protein [Pseudomonas akapageensis]
MPDTANTVTLTVDGLDYGGWKTVEISAGLERQARDFTLGITWRWPGQTVAVPIRQGAKCEVRIGNDLVLTGWVFATPINYDDKQISLSVSGRSLTADLVDCAAVNKPGQWSGQGVLNIVSALAAPYGLPVRSEIAETGKLSDHTIEPGETVFESIDRLLTLFRVFSTDDAQGAVVLARPGSQGRAMDVLELGKNVLSGSAPLDFSGVFSEYQVLGQRSGTDSEFGQQASEVSASVSDDRTTRKRALIIHESGQMTPELAQSRANWERGNRIGKALTTTYKVQGWRQSNGALWRHNMLVRVVDPLIGFDRDMLIAEVTYSLSDQGTTTTLVVGPPDGFEPEPLDPHKKRKVKKGGNGDNFEYLLPPDWDKKT